MEYPFSLCVLKPKVSLQCVANIWVSLVYPFIHSVSFFMGKFSPLTFKVSIGRCKPARGSGVVSEMDLAVWPGPGSWLSLRLS